MIPVQIDMAILIYLMFPLAAVFLLWVSFERSESFKKYSIQHKEVWQCSICTYTYVDSTHSAISRCPQCGSFNQKEEADAT